MSHHRTPSRANAGTFYQQLSQDPTSLDDHQDAGEASLVLEDEVVLAGEFVAEEEAAAHDPRIRYIHFVLGCAVLLPWNALITASPYFLSRLEGSSLKSTFNSYLSTSFTVANFLFLAHATVTSKQSSTTPRTLWSISVLTLLSFALTISTYTHPSPGTFFAFVLLNGMAQAAAGSYLQTSVIAVASLFGPSALQAMMSGQAAVGVAVSGVQVLSSAASTRGTSPSSASMASSPEEGSAFAFFGLSTLFLLFSAAAQAWLVKLPAYISLMDRIKHINTISHGGENPDESSGLIPSPQEQVFASDKKEQIIRVTKANITYNIAVAYVFAVTLAVFPPITISVMPVNPERSRLLFSAVHFFVFNVGDFLGRLVCSHPRFLVWSANRLFAFSVARTLFIPLFLLCNVQRSSTSTSAPFINSDILFMLLLLLFGLTNGYSCSMCMIAASSVEHNHRLRGRVEDVDAAATIASFFLIGGLAIGSFASFGVRAAICDCNPFRS